jgi:hypothetical protein
MFGTSGVLAPLKPESPPKCRTTETQVINKFPIRIIVKMTVNKLNVSPLGSVSHTQQTLPGEIRRSGPDVQVIGEIPVAVARVNSATGPDNDVPEFLSLGNAA